MTTQIYWDHEFSRAGITLKSSSAPESNNMALHCCKNEDMIIKNRQRLAEQLQIDANQFVLANQTHSKNIYRVTSKDIGKGAFSTTDAIPNTDALYTFEKNILLGTFTADCVPVLFSDAQSGLIGVIHSGWQGTVKEISSAVIQQLLSIEKINPIHLQVHLGRALSQSKFEVDEDVYSQFKALGYADDFMYYNDETHKYHIDNQLTVKKQLELAGVPSENILIDSTCTFVENDSFSYRQNRADGRHLTFIERK